MQYCIGWGSPVGDWTWKPLLSPRLGSQKGLLGLFVLSLPHSKKQINKSSFSCSYCWQSLILLMTFLFFGNEKYSWTIFHSRSNASYTLGLYSLVSMMHSLQVMFFGLFLPHLSSGILNNSCDSEVFSQPHCLQVWGICLKKQTSQWR